jgi:hypothetical protein
LTKLLLHKIAVCLIFLIVLAHPGHAQNILDSTGTRVESTGKDSSVIDSVLKVHSPRKAAIRSAIIPGWGQVYNKKYWKVPIIYGALGTTAYIFFYNLSTYRDLRFSYQAKYKAALAPFDPANPRPGPYQDSTDYRSIKPEYINIDMESLRYNRDEFRKNIDYSVLVFILFWGLNVVDATVDAHLKSFDVSPDLSLKLKPGRSYMGGTNGLSLVLTFK